MTRAILAAILLLVVAFRVWRSGMTWMDAVLAVLLGVAIGPGEGAVSDAANWVVTHAVMLFDWLAGWFE